METTILYYSSVYSSPQVDSPSIRVKLEHGKETGNYYSGFRVWGIEFPLSSTQSHIPSTYGGL